MYHDPKLVKISELILSTMGAQGDEKPLCFAEKLVYIEYPQPLHCTPAAPCRGAKDSGAGVTIRFPCLPVLLDRPRSALRSVALVRAVLIRRKFR